MNATAAAGKATRRVFQLLEDHFDEAEGRYKEGWGDDKIAKETGLSITAVHDHRVAAFGRIKPPSELKELKRELEEVQRLYLKSDEEFKASVNRLKAKIKALEAKYD